MEKILTEVASSTDPYFTEAFKFASTHYPTVVGSKSNPAKLALLRSQTMTYLVKQRLTGALPKGETITQIRQAALTGVAQADYANAVHSDPTNSGKGTTWYPGEVGAELNKLNPVAGLLSWQREFAKALHFTNALMSGKAHVLLRATYIVFGAISLLAGVALLARELGMKQVQQVAQAPLNTAKTTAKNTAKGVKDGYSGK